MTHDPLCPASGWEVEEGFVEPSACLCEFIAKVRDDERNKIFTTLDTLADRDHADECLSLYCDGCECDEIKKQREVAAELTRLNQEMGLL